MKDYRPILPLPRRPLELIVDGICIGLITALGLVMLQQWAALPQSVPIHYGLLGKPDSWGDKSIILLPFALALLFFAVFSVLRMIPHRLNYPSPITARNAEPQYRNAVTMITLLKLEFVGMFSYLGWRTIEIALNRATDLGAPVIPGFLAVVAVTGGWFLWKSYRLGKPDTR